LDQSREQYQFAAQLPGTVAHSQADSLAHWETLARREGQKAEDAARREFVGGVLAPTR
jgi:hypothetical protein